MNVVLISTYELGRQPFGLASPTAWLQRAGAEVTCLDVSRERLRGELIRQADFIGFYVPMHTATRLAIGLLPEVRKLNPRAHLCFYGLYAPVNEAYLRRLGAATVLGGEFEEGLVHAVERAAKGASAQNERVISLARQHFLTPQRLGLPPLARYAHLNHQGGTRRVVGYTESSRGCKHRCRHCPIVPVYNGVFRIVQLEVVIEDIRQQVAAGAEHITFGDPDFFNGIGHALRVARAVHAKFPGLTYDVTIKVEHLLEQAAHLTTLRDTGCLFVTSAVESVDDGILARLDKGHTSSDFVRVVHLFQAAGLNLAPTFVAFTPWTTLEGYCDLLDQIAELDLIENVAPIQLSIRLLIPAGSRLLDLSDVRAMVGTFDEARLVHPWTHADSRVDELCSRVQRTIRDAHQDGASRSEIFAEVWKVARAAAGRSLDGILDAPLGASRATIPYLTEPWYC